MDSTLIVASEKPSSISVEGFLTISIGGTLFTLNGSVGDHIIVAYHKPFAEAANFGTIAGIVGDVGTALGAPNMVTNVNDTLDQIKTVPVLGPVAQKIAVANIRITDLEINTQIKTYQFGFGLDFTANPITLGALSLLSFGLKVTAVTES